MRIFIRITDEMNGATFLSIYVFIIYAHSKNKNKKERTTQEEEEKNIIIIPNNYQCLIY